MAEDSKHNLKLVNVACVEKYTAESCDCTKAKFARKAEISRTTLEKILRHEPIADRTIRKISRKTDLKYEELIAASPITPEPETTEEPDDRQARPKVLTFISVRGGVGKTMLAVSVAAELAMECRVALVDIDLFTFGATRWFHPLTESAVSPLTFLDIGFRSEGFLQSRRVFSIRIDQPCSGISPGELFFVPAHAEAPTSLLDNKSYKPGKQPVLVDWDLDDAQEAISRLMDQLSHLSVDAVILDTHPGLLALTYAACKEADCSILVSDCEPSTLQANWLLASAVQDRQRQDRSLTENAPERPASIWRTAINRIPSTKTVMECNQLVEEARQVALGNKRNTNFLNERELNSSEPVFLLPELEVMRLDNIAEYSPTAIKRRGGNRTVLATKNLVRRLVNEGILPELESKFSYTEADNQHAQHHLSTYLENYCDPWQPGWRKLDKHLAIALLATFTLFVADVFAWNSLPANWHTQPFQHTVVAMLVGSLICLVTYICSWVLQGILTKCRRICWFIDACSIADLPAAQQKALYDAGSYYELFLANKYIFQFSLLIALSPVVVFVGFQHSDIRLAWKIGIWAAAALIFLTILWRAPGKSSVLRLLRILILSCLPQKASVEVRDHSP